MTLMMDKLKVGRTPTQAGEPETSADAVHLDNLAGFVWRKGCLHGCQWFAL